MALASCVCQQSTPLWILSPSLSIPTVFAGGFANFLFVSTLVPTFHGSVTNQNT